MSGYVAVRGIGDGSNAAAPQSITIAEGERAASGCDRSGFEPSGLGDAEFMLDMAIPGSDHGTKRTANRASFSTRITTSASRFASDLTRRRQLAEPDNGLRSPCAHVIEQRPIHSVLLARRPGLADKLEHAGDLAEPVVDAGQDANSGLNTAS